MLRSGLLLGLTMSLLLVASLCSAAVPTVGQTIIRLETIQDMAVSPTGGHLAVATEKGIDIFTLRPNGSIRESPLAKHVTIDDVVRLAYNPQGTKLIAATMGHELYVFERATMERTTITLPGEISSAVALRVLEDPPLALVKGREYPGVAVANYRHPSTPVELVYNFSPSSFKNGFCVEAGPGADRLYWSAVSTSNPVTQIVFGKPYKGQGTVWLYDPKAEASASCIGPGPDQILLGTRTGNQLMILDRNTGAATVGCPLDAFGPSNIAMSNDGYYAVLTDYYGDRLVCVSGHDLRGRLDPNFNMPPENVRQATIKVGNQPWGLVLHPTLPYAYVATDSSVLKRVRLNIPGIEHP